MSDGYRGALGQQELRHRFPNDVRAPDHDRVEAADCPEFMVQEIEAAEGVHGTSAGNPVAKRPALTG